MRKVTTFMLVLMVGAVLGESDYHLPPGPPPTTVIVHHGNGPRPKYIERYISSEFNIFGGQPPPPLPLLAPPKRFRLPHPNSLPRGQKEGFDIVRAPVIYHQTVTDTDVTRAIADAFDVVEKLRKPGKNKGTSGQITNMPVPTPPSTENNIVRSVEFVHHVAPPQGSTGTTTTTIVEAPQEEKVLQPLVTQQKHVTLTNAGTLVSTPLQAGQQQQIPPVPVAHDLPPLPIAIATSAPLLKEAVIPVVPATITPTSPTTLVAPLTEQSPSPRLIIPSQSHVTTLAEAVQLQSPPGQSQVRTIIQPVYIPYPVDQNGQPIGALPDYHTMDFGAILSAQNNFVVQDVPATPQPTPQQTVQLVQQQPTQLIQTQPVQTVQEAPQPQEHVVQVQHHQHYIVQQQEQRQQEQQVPVGDTPASNEPQPAPPTPTRRVVRRRKKANRRNSVRRI